MKKSIRKKIDWKRYDKSATKWAYYLLGILGICASANFLSEGKHIAWIIAMIIGSIFLCLWKDAK